MCSAGPMKFGGSGDRVMEDARNGIVLIKCESRALGNDCFCPALVPFGLVCVRCVISGEEKPWACWCYGEQVLPFWGLYVCATKYRKDILLLYFHAPEISSS